LFGIAARIRPLYAAILTIDTSRRPLVAELFERRADGGYEYTRLADEPVIVASCGITIEPARLQTYHAALEDSLWTTGREAMRRSNSSRRS
jgi:hypothetical protein